MAWALTGAVSKATESYEISRPSSNWLVFRTDVLVHRHRLLERR